jgi:glutaredoxin
LEKLWNSNAKNKKFLIYTVPNCLYCDLAKKLLKSNNINYTEIDVINNNNLFLELKKKTFTHTLPQIFINDIFLGGYIDLKNYLSNNVQ